MRAISRAWVVLVVALAGCDAVYRVRGDVLVAPSAMTRTSLPAAVCIGRGAAPEESAMHGETAGTWDFGFALCRPVGDEIRVEYEHMVIQGGLPRRMHVYAWLEPAPEIRPLCEQTSNALIRVNRGYGDLRGLCASRKPDHSMAIAVVFDDRNPTWNDENVERRDLQLR